MRAEQVAGSYRDRKGHVFSAGNRIFRTVNRDTATFIREFIDTRLFHKLVHDGRLIGTGIAAEDPAELGIRDTALLLEHDRIPFISYPYEWPFAALRAAALLHLDLHLELLQHGCTLSDACVYNIQFRGPDPVFIDLLSIEPYIEGSYWNGHRQFCDQFLGPLLLSARLGVPYHAMYRGNLEGITAGELAPLLRLRDRFSLPVWMHIMLPARLESAARSGRIKARGPATRRALPKSALINMLKGLRRFVGGLSLLERHTDWTSYASDNTYRADEREAKRDYVMRAMRRATPRFVLDIGCNTGDYSAAALAAGAELVIGAEADPYTAHLAFTRARDQQLNFLPLVQNVANPSPAQGWLEAERSPFSSRGKFDFLIALAVQHHLAIGCNIPLDQVVKSLVNMAPRGMIEFVRKSDTTVQRMLALREDIFSDYTEKNFRNLLSVNARIVDSRKISQEGRVIYLYDRT